MGGVFFPYPLILEHPPVRARGRSGRPGGASEVGAYAGKTALALPGESSGSFSPPGEWCDGKTMSDVLQHQPACFGGPAGSVDLSVLNLSVLPGQAFGVTAGLDIFETGNSVAPHFCPAPDLLAGVRHFSVWSHRKRFYRHSEKG